MNKHNIFILLIICLTADVLTAQYWQQAAMYDMDIAMDVSNHQYSGKQTIQYTNNSPDELHKIYYHLYFNAFQPNSMMDVRSLNIMDADKRVGDRISKLSPEEQGWIKVNSLTLNGQSLEPKVIGTILKATLPKPIAPGQTVMLEMDYQAQVPLQIRRSGRDNAEGIEFSMTQWYPKLCEYDQDGWHPNQYVGREFYGIWGDFNVNITLPGTYIIGGTGKLMNPDEVGQMIDGDVISYTKTKADKTWKFKAKNVHDYAWAADEDYTHLRRFSEAGTQLDYYYQKSETNATNWDSLHVYMDAAEQYMNTRYGKYPYPRYAFIQGGDGGMEYPMATLITGERPISSLVGVSIHEWMHSWYQMILGTDEAQYAWMDEGFTSFATSETTNHLKRIGLIKGDAVDNPIANTTVRFAEFTQSGLEEPLSTHADHFNTNAAYGVGSYVKGPVYLKQLEYIIGKDVFDRLLLRYFDEWKFKHPTPNTFLRLAELESDMELDWYHDYFINSTKTIDYAVESITKGDNKKETNITLTRIGLMPMPVDIQITYKNGDTQMVNIPLVMMLGSKQENSMTNATPWAWTHPTYSMTLPVKAKKIKSVIIDPSGRLADVNLENNTWSIDSKHKPKGNLQPEPKMEKK